MLLRLQNEDYFRLNNKRLLRKRSTSGRFTLLEGSSVQARAKELIQIFKSNKVIANPTNEMGLFHQWNMLTRPVAQPYTYRR